MGKSNHNTIASLADLQAEVGRVKQRIREHETSLGRRLEDLPSEVFRSTMATLLPGVIGGGMASGIWKLGKAIFELLSKGGAMGEKGGNWKETLLAAARKLGIFSAAKLFLSVWRKK